MKAGFKKLTSILCVAAILVSSISVAAFACLFCDETTTEAPTEITTEEPTTEKPQPKPPQYGDPKKPQISDTDSF